MLTLQDFIIAMILFIVYLCTYNKELYRGNWMWTLLTLGSSFYILLAGAF